MIDRDLLLKEILKYNNIFKVAEVLKYSIVSIKKYMKIYNIPIPKGFYKKEGKVVGRPKGIPMSEEQKAVLSEMFKGEGNPFFNKKHNNETKERMSQNHADFTGDNNPFKKSLKDPQKRQEHKDRCVEIWKGRDEEYRKNFGGKISKKWSENGGNLKLINMHKRHKACFINTKKAGKIFCRSSWERLIAEYLDENILVMDFDIEPFCIEYVNSKQFIRVSRVDFIINLIGGKKLMIEVKPKMLENIGENPYKIEAYKAFCLENNIQFIVVNEDYLGENEFNIIINKAVRGELNIIF